MAKEKKVSKRTVEEALVIEAIAEEVTKKSKKHKKEKRKADDCDDQGFKGASKEKKSKHKSEKKKKKSKKDKKASSEEKSASPTHESLKPLPKSQEPSDKDMECEKGNVKQDSNLAGWTDWNKTSFGGDAARKEKFLKLMGAKKSTSSDSQKEAAVPAKKGLFGSLKSSLFQPKPSTGSYGTSSLSEQTQQKIQSDLEHQFEEGLKFKKNMQRGARRGLGA